MAFYVIPPSSVLLKDQEPLKLFPLTASATLTLLLMMMMPTSQPASQSANRRTMTVWKCRPRKQFGLWATLCNINWKIPSNNKLLIERRRRWMAVKRLWINNWDGVVSPRAPPDPESGDICNSPVTECVWGQRCLTWNGVLRSTWKSIRLLDVCVTLRRLFQLDSQTIDIGSSSPLDGFPGSESWGHLLNRYDP